MLWLCSNVKSYVLLCCILSLISTHSQIHAHSQIHTHILKYTQVHLEADDPNAVKDFFPFYEEAKQLLEEVETICAFSDPSKKTQTRPQSQYPFPTPGVSKHRQRRPRVPRGHPKASLYRRNLSARRYRRKYPKNAPGETWTRGLRVMNPTLWPTEPPEHLYRVDIFIRNIYVRKVSPNVYQTLNGTLQLNVVIQNDKYLYYQHTVSLIMEKLSTQSFNTDPSLEHNLSLQDEVFVAPKQRSWSVTAKCLGINCVNGCEER